MKSQKIKRRVETVTIKEITNDVSITGYLPLMIFVLTDDEAKIYFRMISTISNIEKVKIIFIGLRLNTRGVHSTK